MGYTKEQLMAMGAKPVSVASSTVPKRKYTPEELLALGAKPVPTTIPEEKPIDTGLAGQLKQRGGKFLDALKAPTSPLTPLRLVGQMAGAANDVIGAAVAPVLNAGVNAISNVPAVQRFATAKPVSNGLDAVTGGLSAIENKYGAFAKANPGIDQTLRDVGNVASFLPVGKALGVTKDAFTKTIEPIAQAKRLKTVDGTVGSLIQGKKVDIAGAKQALSSIDISTVKTYADLSKSLSDKIKQVADMKKGALATSKEVKPLSDLGLKSDIGGTAVSHNYVIDAIDQLKRHYTATNDIPSLTKIQNLEAQANTKGLSVSELDNLAIEHGSSINAFNANGEAAAGLTKQAAENTRTGVKSTAREIFGNDIYKQADTELSAIIRTRDLVNDMSDAVIKLQQKIKTRTWGEKVGRLAGGAINLIGLNTPKGLIEYFLGRGTGLKTLNALDLEAMLTKNLSNIQKALNPKATASDIEKVLNELINTQSTRSSQLPKAGNTLPKINSKKPIVPKIQKNTNSVSNIK